MPRRSRSTAHKRQLGNRVAYRAAAGGATHLRLELLENRNLLAAVVGRFLFYNDSFFDGNDPAANAGDDAAIAPDKLAYRPTASFTVTQLTNNSTFDIEPHVFGTQVVWEGAGGSDGGTDREIFAYQGGVTTQLTVNNDHDRFPKAASGGILWERGVGTAQEIIYYDGSETPLTNNSVFDGAATFVGDRAVWEQGAGTGIEIVTWTGGSPSNLSVNAVADRYVHTDGSAVVWVEGSTPNQKIKRYDGGAPVNIGASSLALNEPKVSGQNVVWEGFAGTTSNDREIYWHDGLIVTQVTNNSFPDFDPQVSGDKFVWWGGVFNDFQIYMYDASDLIPTVQEISTGLRNQNPQIDGDYVVWYGNGGTDGGSDDEIFFWDGQQVIQLTENNYNDQFPKISGNRVVWQGQPSSSLEIFEAVFTGDGPATEANISSYDAGINGIMIDIDGLAAPGSLSASDFVFKVGNNNTPGSWSTAPAPNGVSVRTGAGVAGSDRVTITWNDGDIAKEWLEVQVLANATTGLTDIGGGIGDVFFFGSAVGDGGVGNTPTAAPVNATDEIGARNNSHTFGDPATIDDAFDYNRDRFVNATDQIISRSNATNFITQLVKIDVPSGGPFAPEDDTDDMVDVDASSDAGIGFALASSADRESPSAALPRPTAARLLSAAPAQQVGSATPTLLEADAIDLADAADGPISDVDDDLLDALTKPLAS